MNSRERILASLNHQEPDRVPIDFGGHLCSGITAIAYAKLRDALALPKRPIRVFDPIMQLAIIDEDVLDHFQVDTMELGREFVQGDENWHDWTLPDGTPCKLTGWVTPERQEGRWVLKSKRGVVLAQMPDGALYFDQCYWPYAEEDDLDRLPEAFEEMMWTAMPPPPGPLTAGPRGAELLAERAKALRARTDRAILATFGGNLYEIGHLMYGAEKYFMLMAENPRRVHEFLDRLLQLYLVSVERFLGAVGPYIDVILVHDDLGSQRGPQISTAMFRQFVKPRYEVLWRRIKELADVKIQLHCCGGVRPLLDDLIDAGLDAINPVQVSCVGMESIGLKRDFGSRLTFWGGGCDTHRVLAFATPDEVRQHVKQQIEIFKPGGGFVFQQVHNIQPDVPPENIIAMFEAARDGA